MKSLRIFASLTLALVLAFSATPALISADSQHQPQHEPKKEKADKDNKDDSKKEKDSKEDKDESKKEKDSKKDKDKVDKAIDDLDKALEGDKGKKTKEDKKEKDSKADKDDSKKEDYKPSSNEDYEGTYKGYSESHSSDNNYYVIAFKIEKAKKGPLYTVEGAMRYESKHDDPEIYSVQGSFSPKTGKLRATYKPHSKNTKDKGNVDGDYEDGAFRVLIGGVIYIKAVTKQ